MPAEQQKTVCEFFAGIGLVHEALRRTGWRCLYAGDIDSKKQAMHRGHYGPSEQYHLQDIWHTDQVLANIPDDPFLVTASFPCTDMSLAGNMRGFRGDESSAFFGFLRVVESLPARPPIVLLENVPGFLSAHGGADFAAALSELADLGYWIDSFQIDARRFVPQSRERLFLVGYHESITDSPALVLCDDELDNPWHAAVSRAAQLRPKRLLEALHRAELPTGLATVDTGNPPTHTHDLADYIDAGEDQDWWPPHEVDRHVAMMHARHRHRLDALLDQPRTTVALTAFRRVREGAQRAEVRFDGVAGCLRTPRGGSAKQIVLVVQDGALRMRWMSPREYARLQGAPDYRLPDNTIQALFGFGDAVCVPVIRWIDEHMLTPVFDSVAREGALRRDGRRVYPVRA